MKAEARVKTNSEPFQVKFLKKDRKKRTILLPNLTPEFSSIVKIAAEREGLRIKVLPLADREAIELGKKYVHNDICFPAQINIGEILRELNSGEYSTDNVAAGLSKNCNACRALQYYALARKGLDEAGHTKIPIVTTGKDVLGIQPGIKLGLRFQMKMLQGMVYIDAINEMRQKVLPYEVNEGDTWRVQKEYLEKGYKALMKNFRSTLVVLKEAVRTFNSIPSDRSRRKPRVAIVGEILVNYHPSANYDLEGYLIRNGMEVFVPPVLEFFRQDPVNLHVSSKQRLSRYPWFDSLISSQLRFLFNRRLKPVEKVLSAFKYYSKRDDIFEIADNADGIIDQAFFSGEGWLLPGEIVSLIKKGIKSFIIVQPFGCLPNHISGRGTIKAIKEKYPFVQILPLDYDPDISIGNIENRLQMLIITAREQEKMDFTTETQRTQREIF